MKTIKPKAILVDIDGTLAIKGDRNPFDYSRVDEDELNISVANLVKSLSNQNGGKYYIIILSGREGTQECINKTYDWIESHDIPWDEVFFRAESDFRKDSIIKRELYDNHVKGKYDIEFVLDDRNQVVDMWRRELGLSCFQVNYGDF